VIPLETIRRRLLLATAGVSDEADASDWRRVELADAWRAAEDEATRAYLYWLDTSDRMASAVYRAAQDRADQAQDVLAAHAAGA